MGGTCSSPWLPLLLLFGWAQSRLLPALAACSPDHLGEAVSGVDLVPQDVVQHHRLKRQNPTTPTHPPPPHNTPPSVRDP